MPRYASRRKSIRSRRRPTNRRGRRTSRRTGMRVSRVVSRSTALPDRFLTKLRYSELFQMSFTGFAVPASYQFKVNDIFDPNYTGSGHQPLFHDQFALLYNKVRVTGCKYRFTFTNQEKKHVEISILLRPNISTIGNFETVRETPYNVFKVTLGEEGSGQAVKYARGFASVQKIRGITKYALRGENDYASLIGASPAITPMIQLYISNQNTGEACTANVRADLEYYCEFFDRKLVTQS